MSQLEKIRSEMNRMIFELQKEIDEKDFKLNLIASEVSEICMNMGKNQAHDYDGINSIDDIILYLKSIKRDLPDKSITQKYIVQK